MSKKAGNVIRIPTSLDKVFRYWFEFLSPFHGLTEREIDVATALIKHRYRLSQVIKDNEILDRNVMSEDTRRIIREECGLSLAHFQVIIGKLKKNKIIVDGKLNKRFIPNLDINPTEFNLMLHFELKN